MCQGAFESSLLVRSFFKSGCPGPFSSAKTGYKPSPLEDDYQFQKKYICILSEVCLKCNQATHLGKETNVSPNSRLNCNAGFINSAFESKDSGSAFGAREAGTVQIHCLHLQYIKGSRYNSVAWERQKLKQWVVYFNQNFLAVFCKLYFQVDCTFLSPGCMT